jgi:hypothetical protein
LRQDHVTLSEIFDPSGQRARFDGAAWVSQDGRFWWNGTAWQPIVRAQRRPWGVIAIAVVIVAIVAFVIHAMPRPIIDTSQYGATNMTIDGPTQIEFDYRSQDSCGNLTFIYDFYNAQGFKVGEFQDSFARQVTAGQIYHFTIATSGTIDPTATRFTATPNCGS